MFGMNGWCKEIPGGDLISRAAAIDGVKDRYYKYDRFAKVEELVWEIEALPSAQPETHDKRTGTHACDLISRQAVIDLLKQMRKDGNMVPWEGKDVFARIRKLPSAQPDKEKISDALYHIYRNKGTSTAAEGVAAIKYYIAEIWREIYGEEGPRWMKK